jgi:hypothetical protein
VESLTLSGCWCAQEGKTVADDVSFTYRLPLTYVRITGTRTEVTNSLTDSTTVDRTSVITTETGADPHASHQVKISAQHLAAHKSTWNLLADGRLAGAESTTTVEPWALWKTAMSAGATVLGAVAPALVPLGVPGWMALAGLSGGAALGTYVLAEGVRPVVADEATGPRSRAETGHQQAPPEPVTETDPAQWNVHDKYVQEHQTAAVTLATYRAALSEATAAHATAVRLSFQAPEDEQYYWQHRVQTLERMLASITVGAAAPEAVYAQWCSEAITAVETVYDERIRIDDLPTPEVLREWADTPSRSYPAWSELAKKLWVAVSVRLEEAPNGASASEEDLRESNAVTVHYRPPRPAVIEVWELDGHERFSYGLKRVDVRRISVACPGNEAVLDLAPGADVDSAVSAVFDESGALTKITASVEDDTLQRAQNLQGLLAAATAGVEAGSGLRKALSPPSLVERAAEAEAAQKLGLTSAPPDPLAQLKRQVSEQELRARLRIAEQIASSTSPPVTVTLNGTLNE